MKKAHCPLLIGLSAVLQGGLRGTSVNGFAHQGIKTILAERQTRSLGIGLVRVKVS